MTRTLSLMASIDLPPGVDVSEYDRVFEQGQMKINPNAGSLDEVSAWFVFVNALNGLAYRLIAAKEYSDKFGSAIDASTKEDRYSQDHALFGFSASALSALECLFMASYGAGAIFKFSEFPVDKPKFLLRTPENVTACFTKLSSGLSISDTMRKIVEDDLYKDLCDLRNALSHRGTLGRRAQLSNVRPMPSMIPSNPKALPCQFNYDMELVPNLTSELLAWVIQSVNALNKSLYNFLTSEGKS